MKRTWKNFRIDPSKVYMRIGQATVCILFNLLLSVFFYWAFLQRNDILGGKIMDEKTKRNELLITLADVNNLIEEIESEQKYNAESAINSRNQLLTAYSLKVQILNNL